MHYPTMDEVEAASHEQLASWNRFLSSPGARATGKDNFREVMNQESDILQRISVRFFSLGDMTPEISKAIGWDKN